MRLTRKLFLVSAAALVTVALASGASATINHGDFIGTDITFNDVSETSTFGDPEPLFGAPNVAGNQLLFFPTNFSASAANGGFDLTGAQLQTLITSNDALTTIDELALTEAGDGFLTGTGTSLTYTSVTLSGVVTVLATTSGAITPVLIPFTGVVSPKGTHELPGDAGPFTWTGSFTVDIAAVVPNATEVFLSFDNNLIAFSEAGTASFVQKKVVSGPAIKVEVIPEPNTFAMVALGLLGLAVVRRRNS